MFVGNYENVDAKELTDKLFINNCGLFITCILFQFIINTNKSKNNQLIYTARKDFVQVM